MNYSDPIVIILLCCTFVSICHGFGELRNRIFERTLASDRPMNICQLFGAARFSMYTVFTSSTNKRQTLSSVLGVPVLGG